MLKHLYAIFIGVLFATLVGVGIAAFYPTPKAPEYPITNQYISPDRPQTAPEMRKSQEQQAKYDQSYKTFHESEKVYNRNVSILALVIAIVALVISLTLLKNLFVIADGLLLGGILTLVYSIIRGFATEDNIFRFLVVAIGFVIAIALGYIKFVPKEKKKK